MQARDHHANCSGGHFGRRDFLRVGALSYLGLNLSQYLEVKEAFASTDPDKKAKAEACILVWLDGGPSQVDSWDPKPSSNFKPISTNVPGIQISELFPEMAKIMDKCAVVRSMHTEENDHGIGSHVVATGHRPNPAMKFPGFGAIITKELGPRGEVPAHVIAPGMPKGKTYDDYFKAHFLGPENDPMILPRPGGVFGLKEGEHAKFVVPDLALPKSISRERIQNRRSFLDFVDKTYRQRVETAEFARTDLFTEKAWNMILTPEVREAFDVSDESEKTHDAYGRDTIGQSMLIARRLVERGSRFVTAAGYPGQAWDAHDEGDKQYKEKLGPTLDRSLPGLINDLDERGLLDTTIVIVMGEFGRTADINIGGGRDHWPEVWSALLAGGGIRGGTIVGASDEVGAYVGERIVSMGDLFATIYKALGIDWTKELMHPIGRPIKIANSFDDTTGVPLHELI